MDQRDDTDIITPGNKSQYLNNISLFRKRWKRMTSRLYPEGLYLVKYTAIAVPIAAEHVAS